MKYRKSHFRYTRDQRNGTFYLLLLIVIGQLAYYYWSNTPTDSIPIEDIALITQFEKERDSLIALQKKTDSLNSYRYNPNYINDYRGYQLGLSVEEIDRLLAFRNQGKYVNSKEDFQKVTKVSDSMLEVILPSLKFSKGYTSKIEKKRVNVTPVAVIKKEINTASAEELQVVNGVGEVLSKRIVGYRKKLQGFSYKSQLNEVYHLKPEVITRIWDYFKLESLPEISPININTASFKDLLQVVYIDYELAKKIMELRDELAEIQELSDLQKIDGFPMEKFDRIALYLSAN